MTKDATAILDIAAASEEELAGLKADYLKLAREALERARSLLQRDEPEAATYAALELRRALEALVYENALRFTDELIGDDYLVWQPSQLLERLIEIDPVAAMDLELHMQDPKSGEWIKLGRQNRVGLKALKEHYFALGSHLHAPSLAQVLARKPPSRRSLLKLCERCAKLVERDLDASLRFGRMAMFGHTEMNCTGCESRIRRRLNALRTTRNHVPGTRDFIVAKCSKCPASFEIRADPDDEDGLMWREQRWSGRCPNPDCDGVHEKWLREVKDGMVSACPKCGVKAEFAQIFGFFAVDYIAALRKSAVK